MSRLLDLRAKEPYTRLSRVSPALHTLRQGKGLLTSLCHVFYRHIHGACCAGADNSSQSFISRCWHAASSVPRLDMICPSASFGLRDISPRPLRQYPAWNAGLRGSQGGACNSVLCWHKAYKSAPDCLFCPAALMQASGHVDMRVRICTSHEWIAV